MKRSRYLSDIEKTSIIIFLMCFISYAIIGMTRNTYSAAIATLTSEGFLTKSNAGSINFGFYLVYGIAQVFGGVLADRVSPFKLLFAGIIGAMLSNILMSTSGSYPIMFIAWTFNGLTQFGVFPAIIKILASHLIPEHKAKGRAYIGYAYSIGSILSYFLAIVIQIKWSWRALFISSVLFLIADVFFYIYGLRRLKRFPVPAEEPPVTDKKSENNAISVSIWKLLIPSGLVFMTVAGFSRCMLDMGVKSWTPTMMIESYPVPVSLANSLSIILLVVNMSGIFLATFLYPKKVNNPALIMGILFFISIPLLMLLLPLGKTPLFIVTLVLIISTTLMTTVSQITNFAIPLAFAKYGKSGTVAGFLNLFSSFGIMLASWLYGYVADNFGWIANIWVWISIGAIACISCFIATPMWKKFTKE